MSRAVIKRGAATVTPRINSGGLVTLDIEQEISGDNHREPWFGNGLLYRLPEPFVFLGRCLLILFGMGILCRTLPDATNDMFRTLYGNMNLIFIGER